MEMEISLLIVSIIVSEGSGGNDGSASMVRLEHPRCAVMVEVLDQYTQIQRRLEPYLARYYQAMANDPVFSDWVSMSSSSLKHVVQWPLEKS